MTAQNIFSEMETFTNEEKDVINRIASGNLEGITKEDLDVYTRFQTSKAVADEKLQAELQALKDETAAKIEQAQAVNDAAVANLEAQRDLALARLEAVKNGQI
jgi:hypothetical protein